MVKIVIPFAVGQEGSQPVIPGRDFVFVFAAADEMGVGIDKKSGVHHKHQTQADGHDEDAERRTDQNSDQHGNHDAGAYRPDPVVLMLMGHEGIPPEIHDIVIIDAMLEKKNPVHVRVPEPVIDVVGIFVRIGKLMVLAVLGAAGMTGIVAVAAADIVEVDTAREAEVDTLAVLAGAVVLEAADTGVEDTVEAEDTLAVPGKAVVRSTLALVSFSVIRK